MRMVVKFSKDNDVRFVSHLDMLRLFQRAFRRAGLPLVYSQGFNPHPLISFATALAVGATSDSEYLDVVLSKKISTQEFKDRVNAVLPLGISVAEAIDAEDSRKSLTTIMRSATYEVNIITEDRIDGLADAVEKLLSGEIIVTKRTKGGIKDVDIRPMVIAVDVVETKEKNACLHICGILSGEGGLNIDLFMKALYEKMDIIAVHEVRRMQIVMDWTVM